MTGILLRARLRWYALATGRLLLRRWQALLLILAILAPAGVSLLSQIKSIAFPILVFASPEHGFVWRYAYLLMLQALAVTWVMMQRDQICGGEFMQYAASLPLTRSLRRLIDALILLIANSPLFLPPIAAMLWFYAQPETLPAKAVHLIFILDLVLLAIIAQLAALNRAYSVWAVVAISDIVLVGALGDFVPSIQFALLGLAALSAGVPAFVVPTRMRFPLPAGLRARVRTDFFRRCFPGLHPAAFISLHFLVRQSRSEALGKLMAAAAITAAAIGLMSIWDYDGRSFPLAVIALAGIALVISGLYRDLHMAHAAAAPIVGALPLSRAWSRRFDIAMVVSLGLPFALLIGGVVLAHRAGPVPAVALSIPAFVALLCILRLPQVHAERQAVFLSSVAAVLWAALTLFVLI